MNMIKKGKANELKSVKKIAYFDIFGVVYRYTVL